MGVATRAAYRVWQFWQAVAAPPLNRAAWEEVAAILGPAEQRLFLRLSPGGRQHGYRVMARLKAAGHSEKHLLAAALLHDVGKTRVRATWWDRPAVVLGQALLPGRAARWAKAGPEGWKRPFVVKAGHAAWGAAAAEQAGSSPLAVALIRRHGERPAAAAGGEEERLLGLLQWADDNS